MSKAEVNALLTGKGRQGRKLYRTALKVGCVLVLLVTLCRAAMLALAYDYEAHFFDAGLPDLLLQLLTLVGVAFAVYGLFLFRKMSIEGEDPSPSSTETLFSALCGFFLLATVIMQLIYGVCGLEVGRYTVKNSWFLQKLQELRTGEALLSGSADLGQTLQMIALLAAIPGGIYFLYSAFCEKPKRKTQAVLGLFLILWTALCLLVVNFDMSLPMNSPERLGPLTAFLSAMLFATSEVRFRLGKGKLSLLFCAGMLTMLFCFSDALPTILFAFAGRFEMGISTIYACAELSLSLYALLRLRAFRHSHRRHHHHHHHHNDAEDSIKELEPLPENAPPEEPVIFPLRFSAPGSAPANSESDRSERGERSERDQDGL